MKHSIESIKKQIYTDYEVWVIDGGSSGETQKFLTNLQAPFFYHSEKDKGIYDAMNKGISLAQGNWLYFLGAGDVLYDITTLYNVFSSIINDETLIAGKIIYEGDVVPFAYSKSKMIKNVHWSKRMWLTNGLHHQGVFYKNELFKNKKYNLQYKVLSDYHFNIQLLKNNELCKILEVIVAKCNSDGISKIGNWALYKEEINLKTHLSTPLLRPFFYFVAFIKFLSRKIVNN